LPPPAPLFAAPATPDAAPEPNCAELRVKTAIVVPVSPPPPAPAVVEPNVDELPAEPVPLTPAPAPPAPIVTLIDAPGVTVNCSVLLAPCPPIPPPFLPLLPPPAPMTSTHTLVTPVGTVQVPVEVICASCKEGTEITGAGIVFKPSRKSPLLRCES